MNTDASNRPAVRERSARAAVIAALAVAVAVAVFGILAPTAWANHSIQWGVDTPAGPKAIESADPLDFAVRVTLDGEALAGWPMTVVVEPDNGASENQAITTDAGGDASFTVDPSDFPDAEALAVELCDDDGCLYGTATITVPAGPTATSAPPATETPETSAPETSSPVSTIGGTQERGSGGGSSLPWLPLTLGGLFVFVAGGVIYASKTITRSAHCDYGVKYVDEMGVQQWMIEPDAESLGYFLIDIHTDLTDVPTTESSSKDELVMTGGSDLFGGESVLVRQRLERKLAWEQDGASVLQRASIRDVPVDGIPATERGPEAEAFRDGLEARKSGRFKQKIGDRTDEETVVAVSWHEDPSSACAVKDSLSWKLSGRSRVDLQASSACSWCGGELNVGKFRNHPDAHEDYAYSSAQTVLSHASSCDAEFAAVAGAGCSVASDRGGLAYDANGDPTGVKIVGTPSGVSAPSFEAGIGGSVAGASLGAKVGWQAASNHNNQHQTTFRGHARSTHKGDDVLIRIRNSIGTALDQKGPEMKEKASESRSRVHAQHQLTVTVTAPALACGCPSPTLDLKIGESVDLGTASPGEEVVLEPGTEFGSHAEVTCQGETLGLNREAPRGWWGGAEKHVQQL